MDQSFLPLRALLGDLVTQALVSPSSPQVFDFSISFLLENLTVATCCEALADNNNGPNRSSTLDRYSSPPTFTGCFFWGTG